MPFVCPDCQNSSLTIIRSIEIGPTAIWDEVSLQVVRCGRCRLSAVAVYEESRRGPLDQDIWHHTGYRLFSDRVAALDMVITACPNPGDHRCGCATHRELLRSDPRTGSWVGIGNLGWLDYFPMVRAE